MATEAEKELSLPSDEDTIVLAKRSANLVPTKDVINRLTTLANTMAESGLPMPKGCKTAQAIFTKMMIGYELGLSPYTAMHAIDFIDDKAALPAGIKVAIIRNRHLGEIDVVESTNERCVVELRRAGWDAVKTVRVEFTIDDAIRAGLAFRRMDGSLDSKRENWRKYPKSMLVARCTSLACHTYFQEVFTGCPYSPEELGADTDEAGKLIDAKFVVLNDRPPWESTPPATTVPSQPPVDDAPHAPEPAGAPDAPSTPEQKATPPSTGESEETTLGRVTDDQLDRIGQLVGDHAIDSATWKAYLKATFGVETARVISSLDADRIIERLLKLKTLDTLVAWALNQKYLDDESWRACLSKRGVNHPLLLTTDTFEAILDKLFNLATPFDRQALGLEPADPKAHAG